MAKKITDWNDERVDLLKARWSEGVSASRIAAEIGTSRNAVIGKVHRLHLDARKTLVSEYQRHAPKNYKRVDGLVRLARPSASLLAEIIETVADRNIPLEQRRTIHELTAETCRWPVGNPKAPDFFFCGAQTWSAQPYCACHYVMAHRVTPHSNMLGAAAEAYRNGTAAPRGGVEPDVAPSQLDPSNSQLEMAA